jgi:hypothetical protein
MLGTRFLVAGLSRELWRTLGTACVALCLSCSVGHGDGRLLGSLYIEGCRRAGAYTLAPNSFFAQTAEKLLSLRVQRGGDIEVYSDGITVLVKDAALLKREYLDTDIDLADGGAPGVSATAYFNETCPSRRDKVPAILKAVSGTVRFAAVYAPKVSGDDVRITATLEQVRFEDVEDPEARWAELSGDFDFLYVRGSPAQHFP